MTYNHMLKAYDQDDLYYSMSTEHSHTFGFAFSQPDINNRFISWKLVLTKINLKNEVATDIKPEICD